MIEPVAGAPGTPAQRSAAKRDGASRAFETMFVEQLAQELLKTNGDSGNAYATLLPTALADSIEQGGGLGLDLGLGKARP